MWDDDRVATIFLEGFALFYAESVLLIHHDESEPSKRN
jgi:hypothetical protein